MREVLLWSVEEQDVVFEHTGHVGTVPEVSFCEDPTSEDVTRLIRTLIS